MGDHTRPLHAFDETMHVPLIFRHPGTVPAGQAAGPAGQQLRPFPTVLDYLGLKDKPPEKPRMPGAASPPPCGQGSGETSSSTSSRTRARSAPAEWKYVHRFPNGPNELYDLKNDPGETKNLVDDGEARGDEEAAMRRLDEFFDRYADPSTTWTAEVNRSRDFTQSRRRNDVHAVPSGHQPNRDRLLISGPLISDL